MLNFILILEISGAIVEFYFNPDMIQDFLFIPGLILEISGTIVEFYFNPDIIRFMYFHQQTQSKSGQRSANPIQTG